MENEDLLAEIEASADEAVVIKKEVQGKRQKKSDVPLQFEVDDESTSLIMNLIRYINTRGYTYQDLFDFCERDCTTEEEHKKQKRKAYNIIDSLKDHRSIRSDSIDLLCEFLNVDIVLEEKKY